MPELARSTALRLARFGIAFGERVVLNAVDLEVPRTGCTVLLGPSGTGKSSLLRTLAGFNDANPALRCWGHVWLQEQASTPAHRPALVMQNAKLLVSNVFENLVCKLPQRSTLTRREQLDLVLAFLDRMECGWLSDCLSQKVVERSASEQRQIAILREAITAPALLMIDEPTAGLEPAQAEPLLALIERLAASQAVLVVLHNQREARRLAHEVALLANGVIEEAAPAADFFGQPRSAAARHFLATGSCPEVAHEMRAAPQMAAAADIAPHAQPVGGGARAIVSANCGPRGFLWVLPGQLAGTPWPGVVHDVRYDLDALRAVGVTQLVTLTENPFDATLAAEYGMACLFSPMPDMQPPTVEQAVELCRAIDRMIDAGRVVAVHCKAGLGRTGTVLAAYWLWRAKGGLTALQALEDIRRIEPLWVQSVAQVSFLEEFAQVVADGLAHA